MIMTIINEAFIVPRVFLMRFWFLIIALFLIIIITISGCTQHEGYDELYTLGLDYNAHGNYERALDCFNRSLQIDPYSAEVWVARGVTLFNMKRLNEANESVDKALQINPEIPFARRLKEEIVLAMEKEGG
ncbi:MAG: tetratricopeptide repeat protein [Methanoregula sp.]|nr:tetratricopeptide repeat protein [Methanoregula sp.]